MATKSSQLADPAAALDRASARLRLLSDTSSALAAALDAEEALRRLARLVVRQLADACVVDLLESGQIRRLTLADRDPERALRAGSRGNLLPWPEESTTALAEVLRGASSRTVRDFRPRPGRLDSLARDQRELYRLLDARAVLIVPLRVRRETLGAMSLVRRDAGPFDDDDAALAADLAHRAALALDNSRLYALQQRTAEQLQLSLLPALEEVRRLELAARYEPARERAEVGGDWYDAFTLPDGSVILAIGDVVGHDLAAAVRMAQLRNMLRALAFDRREQPNEVMRRLDAVMQGLTDIELVTAVIVRARNSTSDETWTIELTNAGHPAPIIVEPGGTAELLEAGHGPILGVDTTIERDTGTAVLVPGTTLLLYTDGLIERPGEDIGRGLTRLRQHVTALAREPLPTLCDELLARLADNQHDDIALLALRVPES